MARESKRGVGRDASGPHGYTVKMEHYLSQKGEEGATLDELVKVALDERWVGRGFANRMYADRINAQRETSRRAKIAKTGGGARPGLKDLGVMTPYEVEMSEDLHRKAIAFLLNKALSVGRKSKWCELRDGRHYATGKGLVSKPEGQSVESLTQSVEEISADVAMRAVIRMLRPHMHQKTHKVSQAEWDVIRTWLNRAAVRPPD